MTYDTYLAHIYTYQVSEWIDGQKLSDIEPAELATLIPDAQVSQ
jgi:hypothetical protein